MNLFCDQILRYTRLVRLVASPCLGIFMAGVVTILPAAAQSEKPKLQTAAAPPLDAAPSQAEPWTAPESVVNDLQKRRSEFNYVEANVPKYDLPDPLLTENGERVTEPEQWRNDRRAELLETFRDQVYGRRPDVKYSVTFEPLDAKRSVFDGAAEAQTIQVNIGLDDTTYSFPFVWFVPSKSVRPVPAIVLINNRYFTPLEKAVGEPDDFWPVRTIIERGYATASFHTSDVDPDKKEGYDEGVRSFLAKSNPPADDAWRSLSAWGWAASRVLDFLAEQPQIDASQVAVVGHSRGGKTALWAACEDTRFAIAYSNNSGCGGAALSRRAYGETVARITSSFPHWFCKNFTAYSNREEELPVDQHEVFALLAPRAAYVTSADEDLWADPRGEYLSLVAAAPVYELLGTNSINSPKMPPLNSQRIVGQTGYHVRTGGHGLERYDWEQFLNFADEVLNKPSPAAN